MTRQFLISMLVCAPLVIGVSACTQTGDQAESTEDEFSKLTEFEPGEVVPPPPLPLEDSDFEDAEVIRLADAGPNEEEGADSIPGMNDFVLLDKEPAPINLDEIKQQIGYPKQAKEEEIEGKVILRILLDRQGKYQRHSLVRDPHPLLSRAVIKQIPRLKCSPAIRNGKPVWCWITLPIDFVLLE